MKGDALQTSLVDACYRGDAAKVLSLLKAGAKPNRKDKCNYYPWHMACQEGRLKVVKILLDHGANVEARREEGESGLFTAAGENHVGTVRFLIAKGANVNVKRLWTGDTPLHIACGYGNLLMAETLVKAGAAIEARDSDKRTPMFYALMHSRTDVVNFLLQRGARMTDKLKSAAHRAYLEDTKGEL